MEKPKSPRESAGLPNAESSSAEGSRAGDRTVAIEELLRLIEELQRKTDEQDRKLKELQALLVTAPRKHK